MWVWGLGRVSLDMGPRKGLGSLLGNFGIVKWCILVEFYMLILQYRCILNICRGEAESDEDKSLVVCDSSTSTSTLQILAVWRCHDSAFITSL